MGSMQAAVGGAADGSHIPALTVEVPGDAPDARQSQGPDTPSVAPPQEEAKEEEAPGGVIEGAALRRGQGSPRGGSAGEKGSIAPTADNASILAGECPGLFGRNRKAALVHSRRKQPVALVPEQSCPLRHAPSWASRCMDPYTPQDDLSASIWGIS